MKKEFLMLIEKAFWLIKNIKPELVNTAIITLFNKSNQKSTFLIQNLSLNLFWLSKFFVRLTSLAQLKNVSIPIIWAFLLPLDFATKKLFFPQNITIIINNTNLWLNYQHWMRPSCTQKISHSDFESCMKQLKSYANAPLLSSSKS